ncbi:MAG TPA: TRAP transporter large permease subunit [Xanthobacteraceae bacterium]|nr:TRAP transporter large permease subunit [Xanthobacteraceae bacterium]
MSGFGIVLLLMVVVGLVLTGLPAIVVLVSVATFGAVVGVVSGAFPYDLLSALPARIINLLENDLLQALPLYVLMGLTLNRLPIAESLFRSGVALLRRKPSAPLVSGIALGAILGPMNGSVGASVMSLARAVAPRLEGMPKAERFAAVCVASTLGVVVPPSLVLILLGDAMLNAHTLAINATGRADRVINTQDVFRGALVPAAIFLALCLAIAWWKGRRIKPEEADAKHVPLRRSEAVLALVSLTFLIIVLGGVAAGYFYAVEAAAMGAFVLFSAGVVTGRLRGEVLRELLAETMAITGALFGLLAAATTLTLLFRTFGSDRLLDQWITALPGGEVAVTVIVLAIIGLCAFVLDAFEIIFVLVPILIPPLLVRVADAVWVSTLVLLTLQASFLLPPFGYALMMARTALRESLPITTIARALVPFLLAQLAVLILVLGFPALVHLRDEPGANTRALATPLSADEVERRFREMLAPPGADQPPATGR